MSVDLERDGHVATITVNRPEALNAFNTAQLEALLARLHEVRDDRQLRAVIITGAGDRAFIAGADIKEMQEKTPLAAKGFAELGQAVCAAIEGLPQPAIAAINGFALGGGCEIALACDIRLAAEGAALGQPEVGLGILPAWGGTQRLPRLVGAGIAKELIFTGRRVGAEEALRIGLVNAVHPAGELLPKARELAGRIAAQGPLAVRHAKAAANHAFGETGGGFEQEAQLFALLFGTADQREGMGAFVERRGPQFTGE
ncbi:MAG: enoyl-CoA hydratase-related protein [Chloroflexota bacterium]|nr:enoyl-CoA hydratase-related protein [Chloroflexota bacterium]